MTGWQRTPEETQVRVRKRLIETARPELIDKTLWLLSDFDDIPSAIPRGVVAYALAKVETPERVVELRRAWLDSNTPDSFLTYLSREVRHAHGR